MSKINVSQWKKFKITDFYQPIVVPNKIHKIDMYDDLTIPVFSAGGFQGFVDHADFKPQTHYLLFGDQTCTFFYIDYPFSVMDNVKVLKPLADISLNQSLFIQTVAMRVLGNIGYSRYWSILKKKVFQLPVDKNGDPDWHYMNEYIAKLATQAHTNISLLRQQQKKAPTINIDRWKEFKLTKLFEPHHGKRLTKRNRVSGDVPFLTAGFDSQGVKGYLAGNFEIWHNPISIDMFGNCFYHECDCAGDDNVYALVNNDMTSNVKLFIAGVLNKQLSIQFSYKDQFRQHDLDVLSIKLPTDSAGNPDWHYMDEYIAKLATQAHTNISLLRQLLI